MSPIDIVPVHENMYIAELEASMDIVPNHQIYHSEKTESTIFSPSSNIPFVPPTPKQATNLSLSKRNPVSAIVRELRMYNGCMYS